MKQPLSSPKHFIIKGLPASHRSFTSSLTQSTDELLPRWSSAKTIRGVSAPRMVHEVPGNVFAWYHHFHREAFMEVGARYPFFLVNCQVFSSFIPPPCLSCLVLTLQQGTLTWQHESRETLETVGEGGDWKSQWSRLNKRNGGVTVKS